MGARHKARVRAAHKARVRAARAAIRNLSPNQLRAQREWLQSFWQQYNASRALALLRGTPEQRQEGRGILAAHGLTEKEARRLVREAGE
jgi:hypothetical protein